MRSALPPQSDSFQAQFHRRWNHLNNPHVRALAWLLDSPDLLDEQAPQWHGKIATIAAGDWPILNQWLMALDRDPTSLQAALDGQPARRLGRYAESLMAFYFRHLGTLVGHGVQVQAGKSGTVGEFDFLLRAPGDALVHWEFATKFYLLESDGGDPASHHFVGPNLTDTLAAKMHKILAQQLLLAQHPAAQIHLPQSVSAARALVKGWLFYHEPEHRGDVMQMAGLCSAHCHGFWCTLSESKKIAAECAIILPKLQWLAPAKLPWSRTLDNTSFAQALSEYFARDSMPVQIVVLERQGDDAIEIDRGFIVADDWREKAQQYLQRAVLTH